MKEIKAIMAGTVLSIHVHSGEQISIGQEVLILESMKMAIPIESNETGKVARINVKIGDFVNENDVLMNLE
ncbi:acetyl-CoA carboxylase biotin carboxyl carrier protein subunit [Bacillus sp. V3B]|uniref:biotin/lipoyl-containing protein n=1 Tax=Bacillus sp. V3B TaxID=2804915 RepID=UPI00210D1C88|nr:biotin/lipoyl-containing protein [Bacillus sp. V3B]MCQ6273988.1 acetyl-CoA carboxylase biotin carboxyl carrier protein subunit [Bacillus sp. V3B]